MPLTAINGVFFAVRLVGVFLISAGLFLYEDEEGRFQNRVEEWWIRLSDIQTASRSKVAAFMQEVARLTGAGFDRLFGRRLFSIRIIPVSVYLSIASVFLLIWLMFPKIKNTGGVHRQYALFWFVFFVVLAVMPAILDSKWLLALWWAIIPVNLLGLSGFLAFLFKIGWNVRYGREDQEVEAEDRYPDRECRRILRHG